MLGALPGATALERWHEPSALAGSGYGAARRRARACRLPILAQQINGRPLAYLDNAASSQRRAP
jgi:hypothetical protein